MNPRTERRSFQSYIQIHENGCWNWTGPKSSDGYGLFAPERDKLVRAHRHAWILAEGEIPNGLLVLHKCDNRLCVNRAHLFLGTVQDNIDDMMRKGRGRYGDPADRIPEIPDEEIAAIRALKGIMSGASIARKFKRSSSHVCRILRGAVRV